MAFKGSYRKVEIGDYVFSKWTEDNGTTVYNVRKMQGKHLRPVYCGISEFDVIAIIGFNPFAAKSDRR